MSNQNQDLYTHYLLDYYAPLSLFLTPNLDVIYNHGEIGRYFSLPRALVRFNLNNMLDGELLLIFKSGVNKALEQQNPVVFKGITIEKKDRTQSVDLFFRSLKINALKDPIVLAAIQPQEESRVGSETASVISPSALLVEQVHRLEQQLTEAKRQTQGLIDELEATNEELQASNRELLASNEELQSTNEELQSVNEELYAVNSELQLKNEALITANNDILNLLKSTEIGTIFLDPDLRIRRFTPAIRKQFNLLDFDIGRPISDLSSTLKDVDISEISRSVYQTLDRFEREVIDNNGKHYLLRILPYRTQDNVIRGLVITFIDVNELIRVRAQMAALADKFAAIFQYSEDLILALRPDAVIDRVNKSFGAWKDLDLKGQNFFDLLPEQDARQLRSRIQKMGSKPEPVPLHLELLDENQDRVYYEGSWIPLEYSLHDLPVESQPGALVMLQDITGMVKKQRDLEKELEEYQAFMDNTIYQIALVDQNGILKYVNFTRFTGRSKEDLIGISIYDTLPPGQRHLIEGPLKEIFAGRPSERITFDYQLPAGEIMSVELFATPVIVEGVIKYVALIGKNK